MTTPKFCKDCRFWVSDGSRDLENQLKYAKCSRPEVVIWNSTDGGRDAAEYLATGIEQRPYCSTARSSLSPCGPDARLFEPKAVDCPACGWPHPADVACKDLERHDNGPTLTRKEGP